MKPLLLSPHCNIKAQRKCEHSHHQLVLHPTFSADFLTLTMKFASTIITLAALFYVAIACPPTPPPPTSSQPVSINSFFDDGNESLNNVACSNGPNGLVDNFQIFGNLPTFPNIGSGFTVGNWGSPECGSCWQLTNPVNGATVLVTAIDTISSGFELSDAAVATLMGGTVPPSFSEVDVDATEVSKSLCGIP